MLAVLEKWLGRYDILARVAPVLLCGLPLLVPAFLFLVPESETMSTMVVCLILCCGGAIALAQIGRDPGKTREAKLFELWGGKPSVAMLRHRDSRLDPITKARYRAFLDQAVPGLTLASPEQEQKCPEEAEAGYEGANFWLLARTRDLKRFGLLNRENTNYGFRRNLWALKPWALALDVVVIVFGAGLGVFGGQGEDIPVLFLMGDVWCMSLVLVFVHTLFFALIVSKVWVRRAADVYAQQLLATCDILEDRDHNGAE